ncbi:MAG: FKBP-type peptidyl-prolyl cis-trans isomerase [Planctomycetes bacterium]|nr:FKBP-type peptidyl-prolyl cis-trans isomerase [Planctomycetota bacterium]
MVKAKLGDRVQVQYLGLRADGRAMRASSGRRVLEFIAGGKDVIPGISLGVVGMAEGEQKRLTLQPEDAYGAVRPRMIKKIPRERFPKAMDLRVGKRLVATATSGRRRPLRVVELQPDMVVVDANHPLAGQILEVEIQLVSLNSAAPANQET